MSFPISPSTNDTYTDNSGVEWTFDGRGWGNGGGTSSSFEAGGLGAVLSAEATDDWFGPHIGETRTIYQGFSEIGIQVSTAVPVPFSPGNPTVYIGDAADAAITDNEWEIVGSVATGTGTTHIVTLQRVV